ncbi:NAD(P)/FAD-dependent oxidoreductase [Rhodoferax mekongensis]|uniref:NAD(P)/FAD-dependent oxidoreductase n=1 Tax=Rhodoferax mekongensis TaxID=3068341 RepID=UPI0028BD5EBF|nr:NAD(P)/FAD-dependent oxidoreductase [Rhodoferax sp. TBRC 17199]MDT7514906.1 NAD(P)/FAD-dependent oxidoreductase [Rhodoferax sp. TBRC 17199]
MHSFDVVIVGAGAAGLFCAGVAGQLGLKVLVLDHSEKVAEKIRISGGGRSNFTNLDVSAANFISENPRFAKSALSRYTPADFISLVKKHGIAFHEKHKGQLFCDRSAEDLIAMLLAECAAGGVERWQPCAVKALRFLASSAHGISASSYEIDSDRGTIHCAAVVIATGGLSIPKIGATDFGYRIAKQFDLPVVTPRPALVPLTFDEAAWAPFAELSGLSLPVDIATGAKKNSMSFREDLLFTHRGLSGPGVLQISSYWAEGTPIRLNLAPTVDLAQHLTQAKGSSRKRIANELAGIVPSRLADTWVAQGQAWGHDWQRPVNEASDKALNALAERLSRWELTPTGTEGYRKAEVTAGGVDTKVLSSQTMESKQPGLFFIGEVMDVTGWLGGYNFQWAWASAFACAHGLAGRLKTL